MTYTMFCVRCQALSNKTLVMLLGSDPSLTPNQPIPTDHPPVTFAYIKHMWKSNQKVSCI